MRLYHSGEAGDLACGDGVSVPESIPGLKNDFYQIQRSFHEAVLAMGLWLGWDGPELRLLMDGLATGGSGREDSMWSALYAARSGKLYIGLCTHAEAAHFYEFDPPTQKMHHVGDRSTNYRSPFWCRRGANGGTGPWPGARADAPE